MLGSRKKQVGVSFAFVNLQLHQQASPVRFQLFAVKRPCLGFDPRFEASIPSYISCVVAVPTLRCENDMPGFRSPIRSYYSLLSSVRSRLALQCTPKNNVGYISCICFLGSKSFLATDIWLRILATQWLCHTLYFRSREMEEIQNFF